MHHLMKRAVVAVLVGAVVLLAGACSPTPQSASTSPCTSLSSPVYSSIDPSNQSGFLTTSSAEASAITRRGSYQQLLGALFEASTGPGNGLVAVHRLYRSANHDYLWSADTNEIGTAVHDGGYVDQTTAFYAARSAADCLVGVHSFLYRGQHRLVVDAAELLRLKGMGWRDQGVVFYAVPSKVSASAGTATPSSTAAAPFTIAVMPDTQLEVVKAGDRRLEDRSVWLVQNQQRLNLAFALHTGDLVDHTAKREQYPRARAGLAPLQAAGIPFTMAIGNRDTAVTCSGEGETCVGPVVKQELRDTSVYNHYFSTKDFKDVQGTFEHGKVDNEYATYSAGGLSWLVLTLELWPRPEVVAWANQVVSAHPHANVIVATHSYMTASGGIQQTNGGYGTTSPQYLFDHLVKQHTNIKFVFSGHTGAFAHRVDTGVHGNKIYSFLQAIHDPTANPVRLFQVDPGHRSVKTWIYAPDTSRTYAGSEKTVTGLTWAK